MLKPIAAALLFMLGPLAALANEGGGKDGGRGGLFTACEADMKRFCADVEPGEGRVIACVMAHESELSGECKAIVSRKKEEHKKNPGFAACEADQKRLCGDVEPGEGRIIACMTANVKDLSKECAAMMAKKKEGEKKEGDKKGKDKAKTKPKSNKP